MEHQPADGTGVTAVVLCGGAGSRLGGEDKPLREMLGRPLLGRVLAQLGAQAAPVIVVANRNQEAYAAFGCAVVDDGRHAGRGPLAGIAAGLATARTDWVLCVPGDAPLLPPGLLGGLRQALQVEDAEAAVVRDSGGRQPLFCLLPRGWHGELTAYLDGGGSAPREWLARHRLAEADFAAWPGWAWSANTPEEWAAAEQALQALERTA